MYNLSPYSCVLDSSQSGRVCLLPRCDVSWCGFINISYLRSWGGVWWPSSQRKINHVIYYDSLDSGNFSRAWIRSRLYQYFNPIYW